MSNELRIVYLPGEYAENDWRFGLLPENIVPQQSGLIEQSLFDKFNVRFGYSHDSSLNRASLFSSHFVFTWIDKPLSCKVIAELSLAYARGIPIMIGISYDFIFGNRKYGDELDWLLRILDITKDNIFVPVFKTLFPPEGSVFGYNDGVRTPSSLGHDEYILFCKEYENNWETELNRIIGHEDRFRQVKSNVLRVHHALISSNAIDALKEALLYIGFYCESPLELKFWERLRELQYQIIPQFGVGNYRLDFAIPEIKIAIEVDGHDYHSSKDQRAYDAKRDRELQKEGWRVIRFTGSEINTDVGKCCDELLSIIQNNKGN